MKRFRIHTLGCKVNQYESEQVATLLARHGWTRVEDGPAELSLVNTCAITGEAACKSRQLIRRFRRQGPTVALGCWATAEPEAAAELADLSAGHQDDVAAALHRYLSDAGRCANCDQQGLPPLSGRHAGRQRAFLKVQDGCDGGCAYCIVPRLRPKLWSKPIAAAVTEATDLVAAGHQEIILTGVCLGAYGQTHTRRRAGCPLGDLVRAIGRSVPGLRRLRLSSLEPADVSDELLNALRDCPQVVPHFHLPMQSGSDAILRRMNRPYTRASLIEMTGKLRRVFDRPALTGDIMIGFPGESDEDFEQTLRAVADVGLIDVHAFAFSPRPGTAAARMSETIASSVVIRRRMARLKAQVAAQSLAFRRQFIGQMVEALVEHPASADPPDLRRGRCDRYFEVRFTGPSSLIGQLVQAEVVAVDGDHTRAVVMS